jgi:hypothetical protein
MTTRSVLAAAGLSAAALFSTAPAAFATGPTAKLYAVLAGGNEVSASNEANAGDPDGSGTASVDIAGTSLCFGITVRAIGAPTAAHIHNAAAGVNGPIVVFLDPFPTSGSPGSSSGCLSGLDRALLARIAANPHLYYVNIHNDDFPAGAVRGQLF